MLELTSHGGTMAASLRHQCRDTICDSGAYGCILGSKHVACFRHLFRARGAFRYDLFDYSFRSALMIYEIFATSSAAFLFSAAVSLPLAFIDAISVTLDPCFDGVLQLWYQSSRRCPSRVGDNIRSANLLPLVMRDFDIILESSSSLSFPDELLGLPPNDTLSIQFSPSNSNLRLYRFSSPASLGINDPGTFYTTSQFY
ncbi:hypothetical protein Tco_0364452 [Tanacetum coccineum]